MNIRVVCSIALLCAPVLIAQQAPRAVKKAFQAQASSTIAYRVEKDTEVVEITNVEYELVGGDIPGHAPDERLLLRKTVHSTEIEVVGDMGEEQATTTVAAWPLGTTFNKSPSIPSPQPVRTRRR